MNRTYHRYVQWHDGVFSTQFLLFFSSNLSSDHTGTTGRSSGTSRSGRPSLSSNANGRHREDNQCGEQEQDQSSARDAEAEGSCTVTLYGHFSYLCRTVSLQVSLSSRWLPVREVLEGKERGRNFGLWKNSERSKVVETSRLKRPGKVAGSQEKEANNKEL